MVTLQENRCLFTRPSLKKGEVRRPLGNEGVVLGQGLCRREKKKAKLVANFTSVKERTT